METNKDLTAKIGINWKTYKKPDSFEYFDELTDGMSIEKMRIVSFVSLYSKVNLGGQKLA